MRRLPETFLQGRACCNNFHLASSLSSDAEATASSGHAASREGARPVIHRSSAKPTRPAACPMASCRQSRGPNLARHSGMRTGSKEMPAAQQQTGSQRPEGGVFVADDEGEGKRGGPISVSVTRNTQSKLRQLGQSVKVRLRPEAEVGRFEKQTFDGAFSGLSAAINCYVNFGSSYNFPSRSLINCFVSSGTTSE